MNLINYFIKLIEEINNHCNILNIIFYLKSIIIRAPLEALITVYLAEALVLLTPIVSDQGFNGELVIFMIVFAIVVAALACMVFAVIMVVVVLLWARYSVGKLLQGPADVAYLVINQSFMRVVRWTHIGGALCYVIAANIIAWSSQVKLQEMLKDDVNNRMLIVVGLYGLIAGIAWHLCGYVGDMRIHWKHIFNILEISDQTNLNTFGEIRVIKWRGYIGTYYAP